jgi:hypothetical protein
VYDMLMVWVFEDLRMGESIGTFKGIVVDL